MQAGFEIRTLKISELLIVNNFLNTNYIRNEETSCRKVFSKEYLYWYFSRLPQELMIGLFYKNKLVGTIFGELIYIFTIFEKVCKNICKIDLLCIHSKLRHLGLSKLLINALKMRIDDSIVYTIQQFFNEDTDLERNAEQNIYIPREHKTNIMLLFFSYIIPINIKKLKELGSLEEDFIPDEPIPGENPFHLLKQDDYKQLSIKLNMHGRDIYGIRQVFTENDHKLFMPIKNVVYSFVKKDEQGNITDFVSLIKENTLIEDLDKFFYSARITYFFCETLSREEFFYWLSEKLGAYGFDELIFRSTGEFADIEKWTDINFQWNQKDEYFITYGGEKIDSSRIFLNV